MGMQLAMGVSLFPDALSCALSGKPGCLLRGSPVCMTGHLDAFPVQASVAGVSSTQGVTQRERQELLWHYFFSNPSDWWDYRADKRGPRHPDFRHKTSQEPLWLDNYHKPIWVDSQLASWDVRMRASAAAAGNGQGENLVGEMLNRRCLEAELREAVEALEQLVQRGCRISGILFHRLLKRCAEEKDLECGRRVHSLAATRGLASNAFLVNHVIGMYASFGKLEDAVQVFGQVPRPSIHMWSSIILAHARQGQPAQAISFYRQMKQSGVEPDNHIFVAALQACALAEDLVSGKEVHADIQASAVKADVFVGNSLVNMYAKSGCLDGARKVFDSLPKKDVVTWTAMIAGYSQQGLGEEALVLYAMMRKEDGMLSANRVTFVCLLQACASVGEKALQQGRELHRQIRESRSEDDAGIGNSLVNMYAKCGSLEDAREVFDALPRRDVVTWNAMIAGYAQQGLGQQALSLYASMQKEEALLSDANHVTVSCLLQACASVGALQQGMELHSLCRDKGLEANPVVGSCLVGMYSKCGSLEDARKVFDGLPSKNLVTWTAMLKGYAEHGEGHMAIRCFEDMLHQGVKPDEMTFVCLIVACSHVGLVQEGKRYFRIMVEDYGIVPSDYHHSCMVDLLGRSGKLDEAEHLLRTTSFTNGVVGWTALLTACKTHGDVERGRRSFDHLVELEPENSTSYILLGNIYADAGRWDDVDRVESWRKSAGAVKKPAKACIEVQKEVHEFTVGEERRDISTTLRCVNTRLKEEGGHVPQTQLVLQAVSEQEKEDALCGHAEKLALAYGLLNTPDGTTLVVTKNLRMCNDCHSSTKVMSRLEKREIVVRDAHRVHRFVEGSCSCMDRH